MPGVHYAPRRRQREPVGRQAAGGHLQRLEARRSRPLRAGVANRSLGLPSALALHKGAAPTGARKEFSASCLKGAAAYHPGPGPPERSAGGAAGRVNRHKQTSRLPCGPSASITSSGGRRKPARGRRSAHALRALPSPRQVFLRPTSQSKACRKRRRKQALCQAALERWGKAVGCTAPQALRGLRNPTNQAQPLECAVCPRFAPASATPPGNASGDHPQTQNRNRAEFSCQDPGKDA